MDWIRVVIISSITSHMGELGRSPHVSATPTVTLHASRADAMEAERADRGKRSVGFRSQGADEWSESYMEWSGSFARTVILIHEGKVERMTWKPRTKVVTKAVEEPDGEELVAGE